MDFYQKLGLRLIVSAREEYARFELPSGSATLLLHLSGELRKGGPMLYFEVDDVDVKYAELIRAGIGFQTPPTDQGWLWREARFQDPSGSSLCLYRAGQNRRFPPWRISE